MDWDHNIDLWSMGCILAELWTGSVLFSTHDESAEERGSASTESPLRLSENDIKGAQEIAARSHELSFSLFRDYSAEEEEKEEEKEETEEEDEEED